MFAGQLGCEALNFALKRLIKEERPAQMNGNGYGMPSSHAQFMVFWATYLSFFLLVRHQPRGPSARTRKATAVEAWHQAWSLTERLLVSTAAVAVAAATAWSRVYLKYHTGRQVLVGVGAGVIIGSAWFLVTSIARHTGLLAYALETPVARIFRIRDLVVEEDMCQAGWEKWKEQSESRVRRQKPKAQ